jgi:hypothetical protein
MCLSTIDKHHKQGAPHKHKHMYIKFIKHEDQASYVTITAIYKQTSPFLLEIKNRYPGNKRVFVGSPLAKYKCIEGFYSLRGTPREPHRLPAYLLTVLLSD